jgi:pyruvate,water dikinase
MGQRVAGYVVPLAACRRSDADVAGGKGANLGELIHAGFPVPAGFVVTTAAYQAHIPHSGVTGRLEELRAAAPDGSAVRNALRQAELPPSLAATLLDAYRDLTGDNLDRGLAVRSSATAEDMPGATFAGQQETYLNVVGGDALVEAVRDCWASLWSERAIAYRERQGVAVPSMAVVVQLMVPAESAGVLFTANPVTGARDEIVIDAATGLGEAVVGGLTTPDHVVLDKRSGRIRSWQVGRREVVVRVRPGGGTERVTGRGRGAATLRDTQLRRLARLAARIERHFSGPQDVEWAWAGGRPYILQTRPVTALPVPPPAGWFPRTFAALIAEVIPVRPYPLDVTTWLGALLDTAGDYSRRIGWGTTPLVALITEENGVVVRLDPPAPRLTWRALLLPVRLWRWARSAGADDAGLMAEAEAFAHALRRHDLTSASWEELLATLREAGTVPAGVIQLRLRHLPDAVSLLWLWLLLLVLRRTDRLGALISGTENKTAETDRALDALAARIRSDPALAELFATGEAPELMSMLADRSPVFLRELHAFLDRYGHRETASPLLATQPTWRHAPEAVVGLLKARAAEPPPPAPTRPAWQVARDELLGHPLVRLPPLRQVVPRWLAGARRAFRAREDSRFYLTLALPMLRASMLELGRRLQSVGVVDEPEAVFHLTRGELERVPVWPPPPTHLTELRALVERRAAARAALAGTPLIDPSWYVPPEAGPMAMLPSGETRPGSLLHGMPGSPGVAEGPARIILEATHFDRLRAGDVLIAPYTNPAWTPLFPRAAAVVVDTGGVMSHAAIVAREYGIPAVMATGDGTQRLSDGQPVRVDGTRGLVLPA